MAILFLGGYIGINQSRLSVLLDQNFRKAVYVDGCIIMACICRPKCIKYKHGIARICCAVCNMSRDVMNTAREHFFRPGFSAFIHQQQHSTTFQRTIKLGAVTYLMKMTLGHKIFVAYCAWMNVCNAIKQPAFGVLSYRKIRFYFIYNSVGRQGGIGFVIIKNIV